MACLDFCTLVYSSNEIRKTQNEQLIIVCQNLIGCTCEFKANFLFVWSLYHLVFDLETIVVR